jgi:hypothetical protein
MENQNIRRHRVGHPARLRCVFIVLLGLGMTPNLQASSKAFTSPDSNSRISVQNAVIDSRGTSVLFFTHPYLGDPQSGKPCPLNFYTARLESGWPEPRVETVASDVCGNASAHGALLEDGDVLILSLDRLERWRHGERVFSQPLEDMEATGGLGVDSAYGGQIYDITAKGDSVMAVPAGGAIRRDVGDASMVVVALDDAGRLRWQYLLELPGKQASPAGLWAASDGGALLRVSAYSAGSMGTEERLVRLGSDGRKLGEMWLFEDETPDMEAFMNAAQENFEAAMAAADASGTESIDRLQVKARADDGFDLLLERKGGSDARRGHWLLRLGPNGELQTEQSLNQVMERHGIEDWYDFLLEGRSLVLLSRAFASQPAGQGQRQGYMQGLISRIDLDRGQAEVRRVPLDQRYLAAAMQAGDAERQYLDNMPGGEPALLTRLAGRPLVVSIGWLQRKQALRLDAESDDWAAFTDAVDRRQAAQAREATRAQRSAEREQRGQEINAAMAASVGMSPEQFDALSPQEQQEVMVRQGDMDALMGLANKQAAALQQSGDVPADAGSNAAPGPRDMGPQDMQAALAAALADAEKQLAQGTGDPALDAQMAATLAQMKAMQGVGGASPASAQAGPVAADSRAGAAHGNTLRVDASLQGDVDFVNRDGHLTTLLVYDRQSGEELMSKSYGDGVIHERIDFSRFERPLDRIGVMFRDISGLVLEDLTPAREQ